MFRGGIVLTKEAVISSQIEGTQASLDDLLGDLERWLDSDDTLPPLVRAGLAHAQFETMNALQPSARTEIGKGG
jgi:Fic family protein